VALTILSPEAERLAQELAAKTGQSVEDAVVKALRQQTEREERRIKLHEAIKEIQDRVAELPVLDDRSADEILGYDKWGLPH
jgi:antitoxin VapB